MSKFIYKASTVNSASGLSAVENHNRRTTQCPNADVSKTPQNIVLIGAEHGDYVAIAAEKYKDASTSKNRSAALDIIICVNRLEPLLNPLFSVEAFCRITREWATESFGDNILDMVLHVDEHAPHIHLETTVLSHNGIISTRKFLRERGGHAQLQTNLATMLAPLGLERGLEGGHVHNSVIKRDYYSQVNNVCAKTLPSLQPGQSAEEIARIARDWFKKREGRFENAKARANKKMIDKLEELYRLGLGSPSEYYSLYNDYVSKMCEIRAAKDEFEIYVAMQRACNLGLISEEQLFGKETTEIQSENEVCLERYSDDFSDDFER